jgi:hypothetical protein
MGQLKSETDFFGMNTQYNYHAEAVPGGDTPSTGGRQLETDEGGYPKSTITPIESHNLEKYDPRGNLISYSNSRGIQAQYNLLSLAKTQSG